MSLLSRARIFAKTCTLVMPMSRMSRVTSNIVVNHVKGLPAVSQLRLQSTDSHLKTIYEGRLSKRIKYIKIFSLSTSLMGFLVQPYLLPKILATDSLMAVFGFVCTSSFFALGTPVLLHLITNRYVTKINYDSKRDVYIATIYTIFVKERQVEFTPDDVRKPGMREMITTCYVNEVPVFFDFADFTDIDHYSRILGYDKPMDFQLESSNSQFVPSDKPKKN
ncbi:transmembrane protein 70 homolog, mitochondrial isoform X2 [Fopius arisanus]|uniref:Transmembrane protein 70 homolog, mitochondrial isoform X2 n=1 Tax=Fopius arisanus TaxID=64838 RepID=A0A9R1U796_9HYME|nr:PREDICTED: transmembrane protein 70 homolog, mitochondrial isoform X2 [Fopius arisanus]